MYENYWTNAKKNAYEKCVVSSRPLTIDTEPVDS